MDALNALIKKSNHVAEGAECLLNILDSEKRAIHNKQVIIEFATQNDFSPSILDWLNSLDSTEYFVGGLDEPIGNNTNGEDEFDLEFQIGEVEFGHKVVEERHCSGYVFVGEYHTHRTLNLEPGEDETELIKFTDHLIEFAIEHFKGGKFKDQDLGTAPELDALEKALSEQGMTKLIPLLYSHSKVNPPKRQEVRTAFEGTTIFIASNTANLSQGEDGEYALNCPVWTYLLGDLVLSDDIPNNQALVKVLTLHKLARNLKFEELVWLISKELKLNIPIGYFTEWFDGLLEQYRGISELRNTIPVMTS
jgi:hypothetical protein